MTAQQESALLKANGLRTRRARLKRQMKAGRANVGVLLLDPPPDIEGMRIEEFLRSARAVGTVKAGRFCRIAKVAPSEKIGRLPLTTRCLLLTLLP